MRALSVALLSGLLAHTLCFEPEEYAARLQRAQQLMKEDGFDAMLLTMEVHHRYFTGMESEFWNSPTRPYYIVVPASGKVKAVVPGISETLYPYHSVDEVVTWPSPRPHDDGVTEVSETLLKMLPKDGGVVGTEHGWEFAMRLPLEDFRRIEQNLANAKHSVKDATLLLKRLRAIKSEAEIELHAEVCGIQSRVMHSFHQHVRPGMTEREINRLMRIELLKNGADMVPYVALRADVGGITDIVGAATDRTLKEGDLLFIDVGSTKSGYFCDFDRNWYVGTEVPAPLAEAQEALYHALDRGILAAVPGATTADIFHAMELPSLSRVPVEAGAVGRAGHSVGLAITEWPSIAPGSFGHNVTLEDGMVFSIEPSVQYDINGVVKLLVHEEAIVVRPGGGTLLSARAPRQIPLIHPQRSDAEVTSV